jgi:hypothetical protein
MKRLPMPIRVKDFWIDHFWGGGSHPWFAVYEGRNLVCVTVYRRGAEEVLRRLTEPKPEIPKGGEGGI